MALSFKKIFKKEEAETEQSKVGQEAAPEQSVQPEQSAQQETKKKGKHGEPGFCCGSCS